jgi:hypothetical protein
MKLFGIGAIAVLLIVAIAAEYIESGERNSEVVESVEAELRAPAIPSPTVEEQYVEFLHDLATAAENTAAIASLKTGEEAEKIRAELAPLFKEVGWTFQMVHLPGFCDIELRQGRRYVHACGRNGEGTSDFKLE